MSVAPWWLWAVHWVAALVVLAEALNKLERCAPLRAGLTPHQRLVDGLKALAWGLLALGAGGSLLAPVLGERPPNAEGVCIVLGFATLIVRTRVKEG